MFGDDRYFINQTYTPTIVFRKVSRDKLDENFQSMLRGKCCPNLNKIKENKQWYVIPMEWFVTFLRFYNVKIRGFKTLPYSKPGPIVNFDLLDFDQKLLSMKNGSQTNNWSQYDLILKEGLKLGVDFVIVHPKMYKHMIEYGIDYPISRYTINNPYYERDPSLSKIWLELYLPKLKILQIPKSSDSDDDYEYMIIPPDEYYKILSKEDNLKCEVKIDSEFLYNKLSLYLSWTVRLWKAVKRIGNYHTNYDYFERQLTEGTNIDWWKIECDNPRKRMIEFSENEILLVHKYGKFSLSSFSITV